LNLGHRSNSLEEFCLALIHPLLPLVAFTSPLDTKTCCGRRCCSGGHLILGQQLSHHLHKVMKLFIANTILICIPNYDE
jgi:hypothetical protein